MQIDASSLLSIDVDSELRKLSQAQLQGPWQLPTELVRRAKAAKAMQVHVELYRHRIQISDDGEGIAADVLEQFTILLDPHKNALQRHQALTYLESHGAFALLALAGLSFAEFQLETHFQAEALRLRYCPPRPPELIRSSKPLNAQVLRTTMIIHQPHYQLQKARSWLIHACRFTPGQVTLQQESINHGLSAYLATLNLPQQFAPNSSEQTIAGMLGLREDEEQAVIWLLQYGVITGHITSHKIPYIDTILELRTPQGHIASASELRTQAETLIAPLTQELMAFVIRMARQLPQLSQNLQSRITRQIVQVLDQYPHYPELIQIPLFPTAITPQRWLSVDELHELAEANSRGQRIVSAIDPEQYRQSLTYLPENIPVVVLDSASRSRLNELFALSFRAPPQRRELRSWWQRLIHRLRRWRDFSFLRSTYKPLLDDELSAQERHFLADLRTFANRSNHGVHQEIYFCRGSGTVRLLHRKTYCLLIPRNNLTLRTCQQVYHKHGKAWLYPAYLALLEGRENPPHSLQELWNQNWTSNGNQKVSL